VKFQIVLSNHSPESINKLEDMACWLWRGLEEAGHVAGVSVGPMDPTAINIFFEYFPDETLPVFQKLAEIGIPFGIICSEAVTGQTLNGYDQDDDMIVASMGFTWKKRMSNFRKVAGLAEFVWCLEPGSVEALRPSVKGGRCAFLQSGYVDGQRIIHPRAQEHKDIDVLFFGSLTPYRMQILESLRAVGLSVEAPEAFVPTFARTSLIERSKVCLSLNMRENWPIPSVSRISYLINNGALVVWENPPYVTGLEPFSIVAEADKIVEACQQAVQNYTPETGERYARAFREHLPMSEILTAVIAKTCEHLRTE